MTARADLRRSRRRPGQDRRGRCRPPRSRSATANIGAECRGPQPPGLDVKNHILFARLPRRRRGQVDARDDDDPRRDDRQDPPGAPDRCRHRRRRIQSHRAMEAFSSNGQAATLFIVKLSVRPRKNLSSSRTSRPGVQGQLPDDGHRHEDESRAAHRRRVRAAARVGDPAVAGGRAANARRWWRTRSPSSSSVNS